MMALTRSYKASTTTKPMLSVHSLIHLIQTQILSSFKEKHSVKSYSHVEIICLAGIQFSNLMKVMGRRKLNVLSDDTLAHSELDTLKCQKKIKIRLVIDIEHF